MQANLRLSDTALINGGRTPRSGVIMGPPHGSLREHISGTSSGALVWGLGVGAIELFNKSRLSVYHGLAMIADGRAAREDVHSHINPWLGVKKIDVNF